MKKLIICSGAGLSQESGLPTFRDSNGLWNQFNLKKVCNYHSFLENYIDSNEFYNLRRKLLANVVPNQAHIKIHELNSLFEVVNFTTNVDDLLERAGSNNVTHLHGNLTEVVYNFGEKNQRIENIGYDNSKYEDLKLYPVKPNVVFFGEGAPKYFDIENFFTEETNENDICIIVGSSEQVFEFSFNIKFEYKFKGQIIFVNKDEKLVNNLIINGFVDDAYEMSAVEFFTKFNFKNLL